jgi:hypothetical protein
MRATRPKTHTAPTATPAPLTLITLILFILLNSGCGVLLGRVKPVDEKSENYQLIDLSREDNNWIKTSSKDATIKSSSAPEEKDPSEVENLFPDVNYQSKMTGSSISFNSGCRKSATETLTENRLRDLTQRLFMGIQFESRSDRLLTVGSTQGLETTLTGSLNGARLKARAVVIQKGTCVYDLLLISKPSSFERDEPTFSRFVTSLRLPEN